VTAEPSDWNLVVTSQHGFHRRLRRALAPLVRLRRTVFRNVFVGWAEDPTALFEAVASLLEHRPHVARWLGKMLPVGRTFVVDPDAFDVQVRREAEPLLDALAGGTFHVRVERRGHKGVINTQASERALGEHVYETLRARGAQPVVRFRDPDAVLAVEVLGEVGGIGVVTREVRTRFPFVKID